MTESVGYYVGIGAQKCGTTWLGAVYLRHHPQVFYPPIGELHHYDTLGLGAHEGNNRAARRKFDQLVAAFDPADPAKVHRLQVLLKRLEMIHRPEAYRELFEQFRGDARAWGEITPNYSTLGPAGFARILEDQPDASFLFVLRNPVDRYWSHLRFRTHQGSPIDPELDFAGKLGDPHFYDRTDYVATLEALDGLVEPDRLLVLFYEDLFSPRGPEQVRRITDFLGVEYLEPALDITRNVAPSASLDPELRRLGVRHFTHVSRGVEERIGRLPEIWRADLEAYT